MDAGDAIGRRIRDAVPAIEDGSGRTMLFHGSRSRLLGKIAPMSRRHCDFGRGFYMAYDPYQALRSIVGYERPRSYAVGFDPGGLKTLALEVDLEWAMLVAYGRGHMESVRGCELYRHLEAMSQERDVIVGPVATGWASLFLDDFFRGTITDRALLESLFVLDLPRQCVAVSQAACDRLCVAAEVELSRQELALLGERFAFERVSAVILAREVCRRYRREGAYFDELLGEACGR